MAKKKVFSIGRDITQGLEETITAAQSYSGELRIDVIPLEKIEIDPENPRDLNLSFNDVTYGIKDTDPKKAIKLKEIEALESLVNSIKDQGILNPVIVYKYNDKYRLVAGERRTLASILAKKVDIQAKILDEKPTEYKIRLLQWIENIERSDLSLWERLNNLEKIINAYALTKKQSIENITATEIATIIGCSKPHASNLKAVLNANSEVKQLIQNNEIKNLEKAALIVSISSKDLRDQAITECKDGATLKRLKHISESYKVVIPKKYETRGKPSTSIKLGSTKNLNVAKIILDSILKNASLSHVAHHFKNIDFNDYRSVGETFKDLLKKLEELHG